MKKVFTIIGYSLFFLLICIAGLALVEGFFFVAKKLFSEVGYIIFVFSLVLLVAGFGGYRMYNAGGKLIRTDTKWRVKRKDNGEWAEGEIDMNYEGQAWVVINGERFEIDEAYGITQR